MTDEADSTASVPPGASTSSGTTPPPEPPPWSPGPSFSREQLVRPRQGRYVAGVCAALARATNTDPVLWRVLVAVLGVLSGVGILLYLIGWLIIPAEGDSASPIEGLLGKGRSGMTPLAVVLLGAAAVISFGFIVHDGMRASLLAAAVVVGAVLLIKRNGGSSAAPPGPGPAATFPPPADQVPPAGFPTPPTAEFTAPAAGAPTAEEPVTAQMPPRPPMPPMPPAPTPGRYRPPFAPHGPWASSNLPPAYQPPQPLPRQPRPPKPPRERSKLGRLTFFAVLVVMGLMAVLGMAGAHITVSAYFAAALVTVALGLIVGAWFGRARGLIALAILISIGLGISTGIERWGGQVGNSVYRPQSIAEIADRYDFTAGNATLDLRDINFTGQTQTITMTMKFGQMRVMLPPTVDTTATLSLDTGRAMILGKEYDGRSVNDETVTSLGDDGDGGGILKLDLQMDTGSVEVDR